MKLVWSYSKKWRKGKNISKYPHEYIQYLYKKSIESASKDYYKVLYTDSESKDLFKDIVDEVIIREPKPFVFLADLKFEIAELLQGEFLITDGDLFFKNKLKIPTGNKIGFELEIKKVRPKVQGWKELLIQHGIVSEVPIWNIENSSSINLGLMYFNDDKLKNKLINEYRKTQKFYTDYIEPVYKFNEKDIQFSACGSQMLVKQFLLNENITPYLFMEGKTSDFTHYSSSSKGRYLQLFYETV
jgi:hypothetical protein